MNSKQECIAKAYGEYFKKCDPDENGWTTYDKWFSCSGNKIDYDYSDNKIFNVRPKSLRGIENYFTFKAVVGYEGIYEVNKLGQVKSLERTSIQKNNKKYHVKERILKPQMDNTGYIVFGLRKDKETRKNYLHRILAECFMSNPFNKETVNHINGIKHDNRIENLEWATYQENNIHAFETGLNITIGERLLGKKGNNCHNFGKRKKQIN